MHDINFIIIENERLNFENSVVKVKQFITRRLNYFNAKSINFTKSTLLIEKIKMLSNKADYIAVIDIMNPIVDIELLKYAKETLEKTKEKVIVVEGAVPGTQFEYLLGPSVDSIRDELLLYYFSQEKYNNQFNLYKYKRLKMFLILNKLIEDMPELSIDALMNKLCKMEIFERLAAFGEDINIKYYDVCPHCGGNLISLPMRMSQAFCGYIPNSRPLYHKCIKCNLVLSPYIENEKGYLIYDKWDKQDFVISHNNPYNSKSTRCNLEIIVDKLPEKVRCIDLGGGMGNYSKYLKMSFPDWEITHSDFSIKQNQELEDMGIQTKALNFLQDEIGRNEYDLITAWEVIEHVPYEKIEFMLDNIYSALYGGGYFVFSTPNFDSPLCKMNDFYAICPPFHYLCFGEKWLLDFFHSKPQWKIISYKACADFLDDSDMWCDYMSRTAPSFQLRATADVLKLLLTKEENKKLLLNNNIGTEIIVVLQKQ